MVTIKRNLWGLFAVLLLCSLFAFVALHYQKWHQVHDDYEERQISLVNLVADTVNSLFLTQEMMLDVVGREAYENRNHQILDNVLALNPAFVAFGFASPEGLPLYFSSNLELSRMPNLKAHPKTRESFLYALSRDKMVLGRTYYMDAYQEWGIPIRRSIFDAQGAVAGLMTAGLRIKGSARIFDQPLHWDDYHEVMLIRDLDHYVQYYSGEQQDFRSIYNVPFDEDVLHQLLSGIGQKYKRSLPDIKSSEQAFSFVFGHGPARKQYVLRYDPYFELWVISSVQDEKIHVGFYQTLKVHLLLYLIALTIIFLLFKAIATAEGQRRKDLVFQATHDPLTKLPNRSYLHKYIDQWIYRGAPPFSMLYLDMDGFKKVNDSFGHRFGDQLLIEMSYRLQSVVTEDSVVIRQGGDEFIVLSHRVDDDELTQCAEMIIEELSKPYVVDQFNFVVGVSIGIARYPQHGSDLDLLLRAADLAMYEAKKHKNSLCHFVPDMHHAFIQGVTMEQALRQALDSMLLHMVYQPQIDNDGRVYGVEALVRWQDEQLGFVPPDKFIGVAESSGLMPKLGLFILQTSLREMTALQRELGLSLQTSINISVKQFMEIGFLETLQHEIANSGLSCDNLCLEITESLFIEDIDYLLPLLRQLHDMGLRISMDDFGTGFSSLSMLHTLPIDELKIDKSFMTSLLNDPSASPMIRNIIAIGKNLKLDVLAEGIELKEHETRLKSFGCDLYQGYYYARPLTYEKLLDFLATKGE